MPCKRIYLLMRTGRIGDVQGLLQGPRIAIGSEGVVPAAVSAFLFGGKNSRHNALSMNTAMYVKLGVVQ